jgi:hypothetical protein
VPRKCIYIQFPLVPQRTKGLEYVTTRTEDRPAESSDPSGKPPEIPESVKIAAAVLKFLGTIADRFGWPGTIAVMVFYILITFPDEAQKRQFFDLFVLGKGIGQLWPNILVCTLALGVIAAQRFRYVRLLNQERAELNRVSEEKSRLQAAMEGRKLPTSETQSRRPPRKS